MPENNEQPDKFTEFAEKMLGALETLSTRIGTVETSIDDKISAVQTTIQESVTPPGGDPASNEPSLADMDLESMSRKDFASVIAQSVVAEVQKSIANPLAETVGAISNKTEEQALRDEFNSVASTNDDFGLYKDVMLGMVEERPHLSVKEMYTLAKAENPDIATAAAEQHEKDNPTQTNDGSFGGLTPTSGSTIQNKGEATAVDAAEDAWNDTMTDQAAAEA